MDASPPARPGIGPAKTRERRAPRWLVPLGMPVAAVLLVTFFVFLRFPFDRFRQELGIEAGRALGAQVEIGRLDPSLGIAGPGFVARDVRIRWPQGEQAEIARAALRPAWSLSWLRGTPAVHVNADSDVGAMKGAFTLGETPAFDGRLSAVDLGRLPLAGLMRGAQLDGEIDLDGALELRPTGPVGEATFESRDGSIASDQLPVAIPYQTLRGAVHFGEDGSIRLEDVILAGPMLSARVAGGTGPGPSLLLAPLELDVHLEVSDRQIRPVLTGSGLRLKPDGSVDLQIRGNLAAPVIR
jgi:type II secretion system protein N